MGLAAVLAAVLVTGMGVSATAAGHSKPKSGNANQSTLVSRSDSYPLRLDSQGPRVRALHKQLVWLGFDVAWKEQLTGRVGESTMQAIDAIQTKYFWRSQSRVDEALAKRIRTTAGRIGELPPECMGSGVRICADKTQKLVRWIEDGKVKVTTDVRFGVADGVHDTPEGSYSVYFRSRDAQSRIGCIPKWYDGCMAPMPFALFFNGDMAVHFSPTFSAYGYYPGGGSHGCINVRSEQDAAWIFDHSLEGTPVEVYSS